MPETTEQSIQCYVLPKRYLRLALEITNVLRKAFWLSSLEFFVQRDADGRLDIYVRRFDTLQGDEPMDRVAKAVALYIDAYIAGMNGGGR